MLIFQAPIISLLSEKGHIQLLSTPKLPTDSFGIAVLFQGLKDLIGINKTGKIHDQKSLKKYWKRM